MFGIFVTDGPTDTHDDSIYHVSIASCYVVTKLASVSLCCKSHHYIAAEIEILSCHVMFNLLKTHIIYTHMNKYGEIDRPGSNGALKQPKMSRLLLQLILTK